MYYNLIQENVLYVYQWQRLGIVCTQTHDAMLKCTDWLMRNESSIMWCGVQSVNNMEIWWISCDAAISGLLIPQHWHCTADGCGKELLLISIAGFTSIPYLNSSHTNTQTNCCWPHKDRFKREGAGSWAVVSDTSECVRACVFVW